MAISYPTTNQITAQYPYPLQDEFKTDAEWKAECDKVTYAREIALETLQFIKEFQHEV